MSRSYRKAFVTCSRRMADDVHSVSRQRIKARLKVIDPLEGDDIGLIDFDVKEMGLEFEDGPEWDDSRKEMRRK